MIKVYRRVEITRGWVDIHNFKVFADWAAFQFLPRNGQGELVDDRGIQVST
jgi:hypothetical protein